MTPDYLTFGSRRYVPLPDAPAPAGWQWVRAPHDVERVDVNAQPADMRYRGNLDAYKNAPHGGPVRANVTKAGKRLPEVYRFEPDHHTIADCPVQYMWWGLNSPELNAKRQSSLLEEGLMLMNGGAGLPNHINCLTGEGSQYTTYPRFDQARFMAGAFMLARKDGDIAWIASMLKADPIPPTAEILAHKERWYWCVSVDPAGVPRLITRPSGVNSDGPDVPVRAPILTAKAVWLRADELHWMGEGFVPDARAEAALALY